MQELQNFPSLSNFPQCSIYFVLNIYSLKRIFFLNYTFYRLLTDVECSIIEKGYAAVILQLVARNRREASGPLHVRLILFIGFYKRTNEATK